MTDIKWIKISTGLNDDNKMKLIDTMPDADILFTIWLKLLVLAGKVNREGELWFSSDTPYTVEMLVTELRRPLDSIQKALTLFASKPFRMIEVRDDNVIKITKWDEYQNVEGMERVRDLTNERVRRLRERRQEIKPVCDVLTDRGIED
jgi:predicted phage replisome organizer